MTAGTFWWEIFEVVARFGFRLGIIVAAISCDASPSVRTVLLLIFTAQVMDSRK